MDYIKKRAWCPQCQTNVIAERPTGMSDGMGCVLTILTCGLFLPLFVLLRAINAMAGYKCNRCGCATMRAKTAKQVQKLYPPQQS